MYCASSEVSRKLIGTSTRPPPVTPYREISSLAAFGEITATRSPWPIPIFSSAPIRPAARAIVSP